jgi:hypothetical protein
MNAPAAAIRDESRWPPALAIIFVLLLLAVLRGHVSVIPVWVSYLAALMVLSSMAAVQLTRGNALWLNIERTIIVILAAGYVLALPDPVWVNDAPPRVDRRQVRTWLDMPSRGPAQ